MFAKLTGFYQHAAGYVLSSGWKECMWVVTTREATKFSRLEAERLVTQLHEKQPGSGYAIERDENGKQNLPPYGLDNFVVRRTPSTDNENDE
jgi:hypothetical protein